VLFRSICRTGPKNDATRIDKDIAILLFSSNDQLLSPVSNLTTDGTGLLSIHSLTGIATMPGKRTVEFAISQSGDNSFYKVQWIQLVVEGQTTNYLSKFYPSIDGDIDILRLNRFQSPQGVTFDPSGNLYVVDSQSDSLYRFSSRGIEHYSFGGMGSGERQFQQPSGVAFFDKTVYVADAGNNRICRFKLSTDLN
jgi:DNA-binding beta-propeller fold protein YncE